MDNNYGSMMGPNNPYYVNPPVEPKKNSKWLVIVCCALVVLAVISLVASIIIKRSAPATITDEEGMSQVSDIESDAIELVTDDTSVGQEFWDAASSDPSGEVSFAKCQKLVGYGNTFAERFGGSKMEGDLCSSGSIAMSISVEPDQEIPYDDLNVIHISNGDKCYNYAFYQGFFSLIKYSVVSGACTGEIKNIEVLK